MDQMARSITPSRILQDAAAVGGTLEQNLADSQQRRIRIPQSL